MNRLPMNQRLALGLGPLCLALLTACGGGEQSAPDSMAQPAAAPTVCGVDAVATSGPETLLFVGDRDLLVNGYPVMMSLLQSPTGYSHPGYPAPLSLPMHDLRAVSPQGHPQANTLDSMGVEMSSPFNAGSVACVSGISRVFNVNGLDLVSWTSQQMPDVPVERLSASAVNGFEFTHNLGDKQATAVFRISRSALVDPDSAAICHITAAGGVDCATPHVSRSTDDQQWELRLPITAPGVYMLSAEPEPLV